VSSVGSDLDDVQVLGTDEAEDSRAEIDIAQPQNRGQDVSRTVEGNAWPSCCPPCDSPKLLTQTATTPGVYLAMKASLDGPEMALTCSRQGAGSPGAQKLTVAWKAPVMTMFPLLSLSTS
jgi:hypothetical protein